MNRGTARRRHLWIAAAAGAICLLSARPAATDDTKTYLPVAPEPEYFKLRNLMSDGMMPNYKALWYGFRRSDTAEMRQAVTYMSELSHLVDRYPPPGQKKAPPEFNEKLMDFRGKLDSLSTGLAGSVDRSATSDRILSVYKTCQSCHDVYAPKERDDARKYSPPL